MFLRLTFKFLGLWYKYFFIMKTLYIILWSLCSSTALLAQVGIGTTNPKSTLDINGNLSVKIMTLNGGPSGSATLIDNGVYISVNPTSGNQQFYVNDPTTLPGRIYIIRNINNTIDAELYTAGGKQFFPKNSTTAFAPVNSPLILKSSGNGGARLTIILVSDGVNWTYIE